MSFRVRLCSCLGELNWQTLTLCIGLWIRGMSWRRLCTCIAAEPPPYCSHRRGIRCSCSDAHRASILCRSMPGSCQSSVHGKEVQGELRTVLSRVRRYRCTVPSMDGCRYVLPSSVRCFRPATLSCLRTSCAYLCRLLPRSRTPGVYGGELQGKLWAVLDRRPGPRSESLRRCGQPVWHLQGSRCTELLPSVRSSGR